MLGDGLAGGGKRRRQVLDRAGAVGLALYRITQEALHNVIKHAHASSVDLILQCTERRIELIIRDNGVGFDFHQHFW